MKKKVINILLIILGIILVALFVYFMHSHLYRYVAVYNDIGENPKIIDVRKGKKIKNLDTPTKDGYVFIGWYNVKTENTFDINNEPINENTTLIARWATILKEENSES